MSIPGAGDVRWRRGSRRPLPFAAALLAGTIGVFAVAARAETMLLDCSNEWSEYSNAFVFEVDLGTATVRFANGDPPRSIRAEINERFIDWRSPYNAEAAFRLDRRSGVLMEFHAGRG